MVKNVLYVPDLALNLISVKKMAENGSSVKFDNAPFQSVWFSFDASE